MTTKATVKRLLDHNMAEVEYTRRSACGHDCSKCGGCGGMEQQVLTIVARNRAAARVGDIVTLEGETGKLLGMSALVYLLPIVLFFVGYAVMALTTSAGDLFYALGGIVGFVAGVFGAILYSRHLKNKGEVTYTIVSIG